MRMRKVWKRKMMRSMEIHCAVLVERIMQLMSSGFAVTFVRSGSMGSVLRSPQQGLSILSSINAHLAAIRELGLDGSCILLKLTTIALVGQVNS
jgi:hypothetical protein